MNEIFSKKIKKEINESNDPPISSKKKQSAGKRNDSPIKQRVNFINLLWNLG